MCINGGSLETRVFGNSAKCENLHGAASYLWQTNQHPRISLPCKTQDCSVKAVSGSQVCLTRRFMKVCVVGKRIRDLLEASSEALVFWPLHLIVWSLLRNNPNWATWIGNVDLESLRFRKESSLINAVVCTNLTHEISAFFNSSALSLFKFCWLFLSGNLGYSTKCH